MLSWDASGYDRNTTRAQLRAFVEAGMEVTFDDPVLIGEGLCKAPAVASAAPMDYYLVAARAPIREAGAPLISSVVLKFQFATEAHWYNDMMEEDEGLSRPAAFYIGAKLAHKRFWKLKPVVCMLMEATPAR